MLSSFHFYVRLKELFLTGLKVASYGDLSFEKFPNLEKYVERIGALPSVVAAYDKLTKAM